MVHMCKRIIYPGVFLHFCHIIIVVVNNWAKSKKWPEMTKNYVCASNPYLSKHTSYDPVFLLHKFKMMTSPNAFFISSKFCFSGLLGWRELKREKMAQNDKKLCLTSYLRNCTTCDYGFWYTFVK